MRWDKQYETGLENVDDQHRQLMDIINLFGEQLCKQEVIDWDAVNGVFSEVADYARFHFCEEEAFMDQMGVAAEYQEEHKRLHHYFLEEINDMCSTLSAKNPDSASRLFHFLMHWLVSHILGVDQNLAEQIRAIQNGISPDEAHRLSKKNVDPSTNLLLHSVEGLLKVISERNQELSALNASLEAKVVERTQALMAANEQLEKMALTDILTGLPNRRHALIWLDKLWEESIGNHYPLSVMMIDADGFKSINDTYGHDAGDIVLNTLARELIANLRTDDVVCRLGGDEFMTICPRTPLKDALNVAEKLRKNVSRLRVPAGLGIWKGSISIGVAERSNLESFNAMLKVADDGVYAAKRAGRNRVETVQPIQGNEATD